MRTIKQTIFSTEKLYIKVANTIGALGEPDPAQRGASAHVAGTMCALRRVLSLRPCNDTQTLCLPQDEALDDKDALYSVFEDLIKGVDFSFKQGDVVAGTVFEIDQKGAYVDIGAKSAAFCPTAEASLCKIGRVRSRDGCRLQRVTTALARRMYNIAGMEPACLCFRFARLTNAG